MSVDLMAEEELRAVLRPMRPDREAFAAAVRQRLKAAEQRQADDPLWRASPLVRTAAAFLPLEVLAGCKVAPATVNAASAATGYKLLSFLAMPASGVFTLLGAAGVSVWRIRRLQDLSGPELACPQARAEAMAKWQTQGRWQGALVFAVSLSLAWLGASWLLFLFYIVSFGILLYVLESLARLGLGSRGLIASSCMSGLMSLGQLAMLSGIGASEIHFVDQHVIAGIFLAGVLLLLPFSLQALRHIPQGYAFQTRAGEEEMLFSRQLALAFITLLVVPLILFETNSVIWPATRTGMKRYVETYFTSPQGRRSWGDWEAVAQWAIDSNLQPDLTPARRFMKRGISEGRSPFVLGTAFRLGLMKAEDVPQIGNYAKERKLLLDHPPRLTPQPISYLSQYDWVIRAAALTNDLSASDRDYLEARLLATFDKRAIDEITELQDFLLITQLLDAIERPIDVERYRPVMHDLLKKFHTTSTGGFEFAGGFVKYLRWPEDAHRRPPGSLDSTAYAVQLMEIYGVPDGLDMLWVRSFLRPSAFRFGDRKWIAAATLQRLDHLPGIKRPGWMEFLYYERSLLAACVLVGLCLYATIISPASKNAPPSTGDLRSLSSLTGRGI